MPKIISFLFLLTYSGFQLNAQTPDDDLFEVDLRKNIINETGSLVFYTLKDKSYIENVKADRRYYWFADGKVQSTYGGVSGQPLNGKYIQYYRNGALAESGAFAYGLKSGRWITWNENGHIKAIYNWKNGLLEGLFEEYSSTGKLVKKGTYKNDLLHGKVTLYSETGIAREEKHKNGLQVQPKVKLPKPVPSDTSRTRH